MRRPTNIILRLAAALTLAALAHPVAAPAQTNQPSYARPSYSSNEETIRGRIRSVDGEYNIKVRDDRGFIDSVELHQGTVINPTGLTLRPGMSVTVMGYNRGSHFAANEIDTPYSQTYSYGPGPYPYPADAYPYPAYPYYGYPYYGPAGGVYIAPSFVFGFGGGCCWHGGGWRR